MIRVFPCAAGSGGDKRFSNASRRATRLHRPFLLHCQRISSRTSPIPTLPWFVETEDPLTRPQPYPCKHDNLHHCSATPTTSTHNEHTFETDECDDNGRAKRWQTHWRRCDLSNLVFSATIVNWWYVMIEHAKEPEESRVDLWLLPPVTIFSLHCLLS
jgi:hypothetical protein